MEDINLPPKVRSVVYVLSVFINAVFGVLATNEVKLSVWVVAGLAGFNAVVAVLAARNVSTTKKR
jgi:hypothetical protein